MTFLVLDTVFNFPFRFCDWVCRTPCQIRKFRICSITKIYIILHSIIFSVTAENCIEWKMNWKEDTFNAFLIRNLSQQSSCPIRLQFLLIRWKFIRVTASVSLHFGKYSDEGSIKAKLGFETSWNSCKMKILMMLSYSVKTTYLEIF